MKRSFDTIFHKAPDFTHNAYYFFETDFEKELGAVSSSTKLEPDKLPCDSVETYHQFRQKQAAEHFYDNWYSRDIASEDAIVQSEYPWICDTEIRAVLEKVALSGKPFLDIASSDSLGMAAFIKKISPSAPCLVSDIDTSLMCFMSTFLKTALPDHPFYCTSFDNRDIPIHDNSLDYVTSIDDHKFAGQAKEYGHYRALFGTGQSDLGSVPDPETGRIFRDRGTIHRLRRGSIENIRMLRNVRQAVRALFL